jgi:hypothetical protein
MNVEIVTEAPIFLFWEYLFQNFGILSLQCVKRAGKNLVPTLQRFLDVQQGPRGR